MKLWKHRNATFNRLLVSNFYSFRRKVDFLVTVTRQMRLWRVVLIKEFTMAIMNTCKRKRWSWVLLPAPSCKSHPRNECHDNPPFFPRPLSSCQCITSIPPWFTRMKLIKRSHRLTDKYNYRDAMITRQQLKRDNVTKFCLRAARIALQCVLRLTNGLLISRWWNNSAFRRGGKGETRGKLGKNRWNGWISVHQLCGN